MLSEDTAFLESTFRADVDVLQKRTRIRECPEHVVNPQALLQTVLGATLGATPA